MIITSALLALVLTGAVISSPPTLISAKNANSAPRHGGDGGHELSFCCPYNGAITEIGYRIGLKVDQLTFTCTSWTGRTTFGPYGGNGGSPGSIACPERHYISSIYGRSDVRLDRLGIRCRHDTDMTSHGADSGEFGGMGGYAFDDLNYSFGNRPIGITTRSGDYVDAIQINYGSTYLAPLCTECNQNVEEWAPKHGGGGGEMYAFVCPNEGVIIGITYRAGSMLDFLQFTCLSVLGQTTMRPYGGTGGGAQLRDMCDPGMYISSILGRSSGLIDQLGIRCVWPGHTGPSPGRHGHGGNGGEPFDDEYYALLGHRPVEIRVWAGDQIDAIQIKYANMPVPFLADNELV